VETPLTPSPRNPRADCAEPVPPGIATILVADACAAPFLRLQGVGPAVPPLLRFVARPVTAALGETPHGAFPGLELSFLQDCF
jgi:hypothetical protein